jgi:hypothetical protein
VVSQCVLQCVLQWCYSGATLLLQWCYSGVPVVLHHLIGRHGEVDGHHHGKCPCVCVCMCVCVCGCVCVFVCVCVCVFITKNVPDSSVTTVSQQCHNGVKRVFEIMQRNRHTSVLAVAKCHQSAMRVLRGNYQLKLGLSNIMQHCKQQIVTQCNTLLHTCVVAG